MAGAVVNQVVKQLGLFAAPWLKEEISQLQDVAPKLDNIKSKMQSIQVVLEDAENQSVRKKIVKLWLEKLQDVSYDMDDVLDEWITKVILLKREEDEENNTAEEVDGSSSSSSSSPITCFSLLNCFPTLLEMKLVTFCTVKQLPWRREIALRIKDINERVESVFSEIKELELASKVVGNDILNKIISRTTTSFIDKSKVYGRDDDKDFLLSNILCVNTEQEKSLQVISIVGAGGLGKTTLAQMVYNDEKVKEKFGEKRIWVCVSNPFDEVNVARHILEGLKIDHSKMTSLQALHQSVGESLSKHNFLLVLDDVWDEYSGKWDKLCKCLMLGKPESRILVTTRKEEVAKIMSTIPSNILKPQHISDLDCWLLMSERAFKGRSNTDNEFEDIGKEIAKRCKGLPLAAKTLGGILISKDCVDEWKEVLNSEIWEMKQAEVELFPHLFLSYQELPAVLKRCFLILAMFPKDTKLEVERVVGIWMAHGFLNQGTKEDDMVKTGKNYLDNLVSRALLSRDLVENCTRVSMHDILHDFALHLSETENISINKIRNDGSSMSTSKRGSSLHWTTARHLYIYGNKDRASIIFEVGKLRTCLIEYVIPTVTSDLVEGLKMVRALYLVRCGLEKVPPSIEKLIHLRLLDLSYNNLVELPETIGNLYNLQQLFLLYCGLTTLPDSMGKLTNLMLLRCDNHALEKFPESMGKLTKLQNLGVQVGAGKNKLGLLKDLNQLRVMKIEFKSDYGDEVDAKKAEIERKKHITELILAFNNHEVTVGVIAALQPHPNIQVLTIEGLPPSCYQLPSWITSLDHLTELEVSGENVLTLPPFWKLQSLKKLELRKFNGLKIIGREFIGLGSRPDKNYSYFPKLVELIFWSWYELTGWEDLKPEEEDSITVMPNLQILDFTGCDKLDKLPRRLLGQAPSLKIIGIKTLVALFYFDVRQIPCKLILCQGRRMLFGYHRQSLNMIVFDLSFITNMPKSIIYHSYIRLLDFCFAEQPISYLPPIGKLPYLQSITIEYFGSVEVIDRDFLGIDDPNNDAKFVSFPHLLKLKIIGCDLLKEWEDLKPDDEGQVTVMPKLQRLEIKGCPKLRLLPSRLLCQAASLEEIRYNDINFNINDAFAENIRKDKQLLRRVKSVIVDNQQCSLHPSTMSENERGSGTINSPSFVIVLLFIVIFELELCLI